MTAVVATAVVQLPSAARAVHAVDAEAAAVVVLLEVAKPLH